MIEYMGFAFMAQVPGVLVSYSNVFLIDTGMGAAKTVQVQSATRSFQHCS